MLKDSQYVLKYLFEISESKSPESPDKMELSNLESISLNNSNVSQSSFNASCKSMIKATFSFLG